MFVEVSTSSGAGVELELTGEWRALQIAGIERELAAVDVAAGSAVRIGTQRLAALDLSGAWALREFLHRARGAGTDVTFRGAPPDQLRLLDETLAAADATTGPTAAPVLTEQAVLTAIGRNAVRAGADLIDGLGFVGRASVSFLRSLTSLKRLRLTSVARHVY